MSVKTFLFGKPRDGRIKTTADLSKTVKIPIGMVLAKIFVEETGKHCNHYIDRSLIPAGAVERRWKGEPFFILTLTKDKNLLPIEPDRIKDNTNEAPEDCYGALQWPELKIIFKLATPMIEKIKLTAFFIICGMLVIVVFLIAVVAMGG